LNNNTRFLMISRGPELWTNHDVSGWGRIGSFLFGHGRTRTTNRLDDE